MYFFKFLPKIKEESIFKSYFIFTFSVIILATCAVCYVVIGEEKEQLDKEINRIQSAVVEQKKGLIKSEVKRVKEYIDIERKNALKDTKEKIKEQTDNAYKIIENEYKIFRQNRQELKKGIRKLDFFEGRGYIFVIRMKDGVWEMLPTEPSKEGVSAYSHKDENGKTPLFELKKQVEANPDGCFVEYKWKNPVSGKVEQKISYVKYFAPLDWMIGSGEYIEAVENRLKQKAADHILNMRFENDGYTSIFQNDGKVISVPSVGRLAGFNIYEAKDPLEQRTKDIVSTLTEQAKKGGGFYRYEWIKPSTRADTPKIAYAEEYKDWNWIIATGTYIDDMIAEEKKRTSEIEDIHRHKLISTITISVIVSIVTAIFLAIITVSFTSILRGYKGNLQQKNSELEELNKGLEARVAAEVAKSEERQYLLLKQSRLAAMGELISNIAHYWRQPLNAVSIMLQDFPIAYAEGEIDEKYVNSNTQKAVSLIDDLSKSLEKFRSFFAPDTDKTAFGIISKVKEALSLLSASLEAKEVSVSINNAEELESIGHPNEFMQVILNILLNSKDAIVKNKVENGAIDISISKQNDDALITITDNGGGIPEDVIDKIFEPYFTTKFKSNGAGMGLYMSKSIIEESMGGTIEITSVESKTTVNIKVPAK